ncbi:MAG: HipA family kinase [Thermoanaerobaculia bacterium]
MRTVQATEYVMPLREGGSLPAIVAGDDDGTYVAKFRGAGQGHRALVAELVSGELARALGLPVPEIVFTIIDARMAKTEPDPEIQDLLRKSDGLNLALDYLPGSIGFDPLVPAAVASDPRLASSIVWFDALVTNVDRTPRNPNLLVWHRKLWMIDHGATLIVHHNWTAGYAENAGAPFARIKEHVLLPWASQIAEVDEGLAAKLGDGVIEGVIAMIPDAWLGDDPLFASVEEHRAAYRTLLTRRLESPRRWVEEAVRARTTRV